MKLACRILIRCVWFPFGVVIATVLGALILLVSPFVAFFLYPFLDDGRDWDFFLMGPRDLARDLASLVFLHDFGIE